MNESKKKAYSHVSTTQRAQLEVLLDQGLSFRAIAKTIGLDVSTISREVKRNKREYELKQYGYESYIPCGNSASCPFRKSGNKWYKCSPSCENYIKPSCNTLKDRFSRKVCNSCPNFQSCKITRYKYKTGTAEAKSESRAHNSRSKVRVTKDHFDFINSLFSSLMINNRQSLEQIYYAHEDEILVSLNTIRNWFRKGYLDSNALDTRRPRFNGEIPTSKRKHINNPRLIIGRQYSDFLKIKDEFPYVQLDTVVGNIADHNRILTLHVPSLHFQFGVLIKDITALKVNQAIIDIRSKIGDDLYELLFNRILTDNGFEFQMLDKIEYCKDKKITSVYFCDPYQSSQKGACERNHEFIRYVLPKGTSFDSLTQGDVELMFSHISSAPIAQLFNRIPYECACDNLGLNLLNALNIQKVKEIKCL